MIRDTQKRRLQKPLKNSPELKIKEWLMRNFKESWWTPIKNDCDCPQMNGLKPCWSCKRWDGWIQDYRKGRIGK